MAAAAAADPSNSALSLSAIMAVHLSLEAYRFSFSSSFFFVVFLGAFDSARSVGPTYGIQSTAVLQREKVCVRISGTR